MPNWRELLGGGDSPSGVFDGTITKGAEDLQDKITVVIPFHDGSQEFGPAPWMPRIGSDGMPVLPAEGDRCLVALGDTDDNGEPEIWVPAWWPYDD